MIALLRAELTKLRTTRTFFSLVGSALAISLLIVVLTTLLSDTLTSEDVRSLFIAEFAGLFILLLGIIGMAGEWRHRTITGTVLAAPNRLLLLAAKTLSYALAGVVLALIVTITIMAVGTLILSSRGGPTLETSDLADVLWRNLAVGALLGALGVVVGALVRNQIAGVIGVLVLRFAIEIPVILLAPDVGQFLPTLGAPAGITFQDFGDTGLLLEPGIAILVMLGWIAAFFVASATLLRQRDLI